jgi:hypothetical protein
MHKNDLLEYLEGIQDSHELREKIRFELDSFGRNLKERGRSAHIVFDGDKDKTYITSYHLRRICDDYLTGATNDLFISYIADALLLSPNSEFESEHLKESFELLTDFDIHGPLSSERILEIYPPRK